MIIVNIVQILLIVKCQRCAIIKIILNWSINYILIKYWSSNHHRTKKKYQSKASVDAKGTQTKGKVRKEGVWWSESMNGYWKVKWRQINLRTPKSDDRIDGMIYNKVLQHPGKDRMNFNIS